VRRPTNDEIRLYGLALACGAAAEVGLVLAWYLGALPGSVAGLLLLPEAVILGWVFGAEAGALAAIIPIWILFGFDRVNAAPPAGATAAIVFVSILLGFLAWMTGTLRARYLR
jgi:hypothetical protein